MKRKKPLKRKKTTPEQEVLLEGLFSGLFFGIYLKTGVSVDPVDLMVNVLNTTQQITQSMPHTWSVPNYVPLFTIMVSIISFLAMVGSILSVKNKIIGLSLFFGGFLLMLAIIFYAYH